MILDTSVLIDVQNGMGGTIRRLDELRKVKHGIGYVAFITYFEFYQGIMQRKDRAGLLSFLDQFALLRPTKKTALILAELKEKLERKGIVIPLADLLIACQAIEHGLTLVTKDAVFLRIQGLDVTLFP